ncbi:hypothetical protein [Gordonia iterans]
MKRVVSILGMLAAAVVALLVVPVGTAGATPAHAVDLGPVQVELVDGAIALSVTSGAVKQVGNELELTNARGVVKNRIPLSVTTSDRKTYPLRANVAADGKSVHFSPAALPKRPLPKPKNKEQAYNQMMKLWNQNAACVGPAAAVGALIGLFFIVGWIVGGLIGAYVGLENCGRGVWGDRYRGETVRAFWKWWNWG